LVLQVIFFEEFLKFWLVRAFSV